MDQEVISRLTKDIRLAAKSMSDIQARFVVDTYYVIQDNRKAIASTIGAIQRDGENEPHLMLDYMLSQFKVLESQAKNSLGHYCSDLPEWAWLDNVIGIGPVITAGLHAHIDMEKTPSVSSLWSFAGYNPNAVWEKGQKRPWNAALKTLCWKIGESFVKVSNKEESFYGRYYVERKAELEAKNDAGNFKESAAKYLTEKNYGKTTDAYKALSAGRLPQAQIHARAKRLAVKLFLSHYFDVRYRDHFGKEPPAPWVFEHGGHVHRIPVPAS